MSWASLGPCCGVLGQQTHCKVWCMMMTWPIILVEGSWEYVWKRLNFETVWMIMQTLQWSVMWWLIKLLLTWELISLPFYLFYTILNHKQITAYMSCLPKLSCNRRRRIPEFWVMKGRHFYSSLLSDCLQFSVSAPIAIQPRPDNGSPSQLARIRLAKGLTTQHNLLWL